MTFFTGLSDVNHSGTEDSLEELIDNPSLGSLCRLYNALRSKILCFLRTLHSRETTLSTQEVTKSCSVYLLQNFSYSR